MPESLAAPFDKSSPSKYDSDPTKQAFSGPYMIQSYSRGPQHHAGAQPELEPARVDGVRPAYADKIVWNAGADPTVAAHQTLDSTNLLMADGPPSSVLKTAYESKKSQLSIAPLGNHYASLNTQVPPFNNINLRKAAIAAHNREALPAGPRREARRLGRRRTSSTPRCPASRRPAAQPAAARTTSPSPTGDMAVARST